MYKTKNPVFMKEIFCENENHYDLRNGNEFSLPRVRTVGLGWESIRFRGPRAWASVPHIIKCSKTHKNLEAKWNFGLLKPANAACAKLSFQILASFRIFVSQ